MKIMRLIKSLSFSAYYCSLQRNWKLRSNDDIYEVCADKYDKNLQCFSSRSDMSAGMTLYVVLVERTV